MRSLEITPGRQQLSDVGLPRLYQHPSFRAHAHPAMMTAEQPELPHDESL
jgi:hypothetical protein